MNKSRNRAMNKMNRTVKGTLLGTVLLLVSVFAAGPAYSGTTFLLYGDNQIGNSTTVEILDVQWRDEGGIPLWVTVGIDDDSISGYEMIGDVSNIFLHENSPNRWKVKWKCSGGASHTTEEAMDDNKTTLRFKSCDGTVDWVD